MKIVYLDRDWEPIGEKDVNSKYLLPDKIVTEFQHIVEIAPKKSFSFLEKIHINPVEDIVEFKDGIEQIYFFDIGKVLKNNFNISLFYEKINNDLDALGVILNKEMVENVSYGTVISDNCAGIEIDIIGINYGMVFIHVPFGKEKQKTIEEILEISQKIEHFFYSFFDEIKKVSKGVFPLIPSYAYDRKKPKVFISHASKDKSFARKLRDSLHYENINTWFDEDDILVGDDFIESIENGLSECDFIVIILSPNFINGPWAIKEYRAALTDQVNKGIIKILPIKYKNVTPPPLLNSISHADLSKNYKRGFKQLVRTIHRRYKKKN